MKFTILQIDLNGDGYTHLYYSNMLVVEGDEYHNKIATYIRGYIDGYKRCSAVNDIGEDFPLQITVEEIGFEKDDWIYENFSAEDYLDKTIRRLEKDGFTRVKDE
jgi:hypothetical protein